MTRDCCFCYCFLFSYDEEDFCNGTRHNTTVINTQTEKPEKAAANNSMILTIKRKQTTNETVFTTAIHTGLKSYLFSGIVPCQPFFAVVYEVLTGGVIKSGELSQSLCQFSSRTVICSKGTGNEVFDWLIIPLPIPIPLPVTLFSLDQKRRNRKRNRKKKKLF